MHGCDAKRPDADRFGDAFQLYLSHHYGCRRDGQDRRRVCRHRSQNGRNRHQHLSQYHARRPEESLMRLSLQHGVALLIAVMLILAVAAFGAIMAGSIAASDVTDSSYQGASIEALYAADTGLERAMKRFETGTACASLGAAAMDVNLTTGRTFTLAAGLSTAFDGTTALQTSQCRVQSTGAVSGTSATRKLHAIVDRNMLVRRNASFDSPAGVAGATS